MITKKGAKNTFTSLYRCCWLCTMETVIRKNVYNQTIVLLIISGSSSCRIIVWRMLYSKFYVKLRKKPVYIFSKSILTFYHFEKVMKRNLLTVISWITALSIRGGQEEAPEDPQLMRLDNMLVSLKRTIRSAVLLP